MLNDSQKKKVSEIWGNYDAGAARMKNPSGVDTSLALDAKRDELIPRIRKLFDDYFAGRVGLAEMKTANDGINKSQNYWGFRGMNGQMFFNMFFNCSEEQGRLDALDKLLKAALPVPKDSKDAAAKIGAITKFSAELGEKCSDRRQAPRTGSCLFFLTYFWQVQAPDRWPVYYNSMVTVLMAESLWSPNNEYATDYVAFCQLNEDIRNLAAERSGKPVTLWDIEHALWIWGEKTKSDEPPKPQVEAGKPVATDLPSSYVPPVVDILPMLARNDPEMVAACAKAGVSVERLFEQRLGVLFQMMGFHIEILGQGKGREPDGIATTREFGYAIVFDAKVRQSGYAVGTDDRAIKEYIGRHVERLRKQGVKNVYFAIVSSAFGDDYDAVIRRLKMETDIREILFIEATALVTFLEHKLRSPDIDLGQQGLQGILVNSGVVRDADMRVHLGL